MRAKSEKKEIQSSIETHKTAAEKVTLPEAFIVRRGQPEAAIVIGKNSPPFYRWVAGEVQRYVRRLSGVELPIATDDSVPDHGMLLLIGGPAINAMTSAAMRITPLDFTGLKEDGFFLRTTCVDGRQALLVAGADERSTMYAAYDLIERLGIVFQFTGDIVPQSKSDLVLPALDVRCEPAIKHRGFHMRHFVMPWMGYEDFCQMTDQLARMKCNYLEFYWYVGSPWIEYSYHGEKKLIGDLYCQESGYTAWRCETGPFSTADVVIGKEHFAYPRSCAPEFQDCNTQEEAYRIAQTLLRRMIEYAHQRKIEIWLGAGDCPAVPPNLGRLARDAKPGGQMGQVIPPGDPAGVDIWTAALESMIATYPEADGYWLWLAEGYYEMGDPDSVQVLRQYEDLRRLIPGKDQLLAMGYDQYLRKLDDQFLFQSDLGLVHYGKQVTDRVRKSHPQARLGVSLLGRSYLFRALDAILPRDIRLQSMEAAICWNRSSRVPMENFGGLGGRETFLVPRLDDDANEFAMQFNAGLYEHDRVISGSHAFGVSGIAPQVGKTRGLEQNARFIAEGCWNPSLRAAEFYTGYVERTFGPEAREVLSAAYRMLDENELFLGLRVDAREYGGGCFQGMGNFFNYTDSCETSWLTVFRHQKNPAAGMDYVKLWGAEGVENHFHRIRYRLQRFQESIPKWQVARELLQNARFLVQPGSRGELEYVIVKTEAFILHLRACCALMQGLLAYEAAYTAKRAGQPGETERQFDACEAFFAEAHVLTVATACKSASLIDHPSERFILFRYNVRQLLPIREFQKFIKNVVNYHHGKPYWEKVNWDIITGSTLLI